MSQKEITGLLIFPDYCSTGLWVRYDHQEQHVSIDLADLPFVLDRNIRAKIRVMCEAYDLFGYPHGDFPSMMGEDSLAFMIYEIYEDIKRHHPQLAPLLVVPDWLEPLFDPEPDAFLHRYQKPGKSVVCADLGQEPVEEIARQGFELVDVVPLKKMVI